MNKKNRNVAFYNVMIFIEALGIEPWIITLVIKSQHFKLIMLETKLAIYKHKSSI